MSPELRAALRVLHAEHEKSMCDSGHKIAHKLGYGCEFSDAIAVVERGLRAAGETP